MGLFKKTKTSTSASLFPTVAYHTEYHPYDNLFKIKYTNPVGEQRHGYTTSHPRAVIISLLIKIQECPEWRLRCNKTNMDLDQFREWTHFLDGDWKVDGFIGQGYTTQGCKFTATAVPECSLTRQSA